MRALTPSLASAPVASWARETANLARSLARFWGPNAASDRIASPILSSVPFASGLAPDRPVSKGNMKSVVQQGMHFIVGGDGREQLFDIVRDPFESKDLFGVGGAPELIGALRRAVADSPTGIPPT